MILDPKKKSHPLRTQPGATGTYTYSPAMQAVIERCRTPKQITPVGSPVKLIDEVARINGRSEAWRAR